MIFTLKHLKKFIHSIKNKQINHINLRTKNINILINKNKTIHSIYSYHKSFENHYIDNQNQQHNNYINIAKNKTSSVSKSNIVNNDAETYSTIISPMVGTFYKSPAPNEPTFIEKNDIVKKKQTVCIIEAMKLMNEIESEVNGEVIDILVNDGDIVDCGQALMKVKII
uniref:Biotin carboxyl carrier protein of acetyl-CoA carboxylase n=1 Tax=Nitophyllum punctatum TaxID=158729 RepID=A0A4D6WZ06_9FLOR|nr:acetyl-CoA carboxylase, biotin carboxyl carrier protein [Nitophyllum punctatum]